MHLDDNHGCWSDVPALQYGSFSTFDWHFGLLKIALQALTDTSSPCFSAGISFSFMWVCKYIIGELSHQCIIHSNGWNSIYRIIDIFISFLFPLWCSLRLSKPQTNPTFFLVNSFILHLYFLKRSSNLSCDKTCLLLSIPLTNTYHVCLNYLPT